MSNKNTVYKLKNLNKNIKKIAKDPQLQKVIGKPLLELEKCIYKNLKEYKQIELNRQFIETGYIGHIPQPKTAKNICSICGQKTSFSESSNQVRKYHNMCSECFNGTDEERYTPLDFD